MLRLISAALFACWINPALSQNWYEVEILVFSQSQADAYSPGATEERWPETLRPEWPEPLVRLNAAASPSPALRPLAVASRRMNNDAYALRVTSGYEVLWHQAWRQPMLSESNAPWIQIRTGSEQNGRYSLEGAIRIYLERFLHLDTDLWFSQFDLAQQNALTVSTEEDPLPPAFALPALIMGTPACAFYTESWPTNVVMEIPDLEPGEILENWWFPPFDCSNNAIDLPAGLPLARALDPYVRVERPTIRFQILNDFDLGPAEVQEVRPLFIGNSPFDAEQEHEQAQAQIAQIIPMRQSRRMRSGELHYLDHPRLGVLALITPIDAPVVDLDETLPNP